jgi:hypothetical protein
MFVDDPGNAVDQADKLIGEVMRARGYPVGDFEQRASDISVNHPQVVDHYRTAHSIAVRGQSGDTATEQLRQAFVHYRALFADLLEVTDSERAKSASAAETPTGRAPESTRDEARTETTTPAARTPTREATTTPEADAAPAETRSAR